MAIETFRFGDFLFDPGNRQLSRAGERIELSSRYLDALALMVSDAGSLISKNRFLDEVWQGVHVTDEALTQCIKTLRKALDDDAASPRFIETVPKHGYRFIALVEFGFAGSESGAVSPAPDRRYTRLQQFLVTGLAAMAGGASAGAIGGLLYGVGAASQAQSGGGALSALLVLWLLTIMLAIIGAAGVGFGIAATEAYKPQSLLAILVGGGLGGMAVGAFARLLGFDAFNLLFGSSPQDFTGASEGAILGVAAGAAFWCTRRMAHNASILRLALPSVLLGAAAAFLIFLTGGRLLGGSLAALAEQFPQSSLSLDPLGILAGENSFGMVSQTVSAGLEAMLFCASLSIMLVHASRRGVTRN
ncbi:MAG: transcriptional regulator [Sphingomonadales bacterium]|nr:transcriptional regulator [Sphingomonadales bacterium]